ncbi:tetratricopeptide repeat protein [Candidatus Bipolaricaulota bacterium]|nr:tetratricopeptide repeat protein [Candidatus Bipolaricaulota bacterium]
MDERRLSALMLTDIVGYTAKVQADEQLALELLEEHNHLLKAILLRHNGRLIKGTGDGFLVEFRSALDAARCAIDVQTALHERNLASPDTRRVEVRVGLHVGDVVHRGGDVFGDGVNITSRIEPLAPPGGIVLTTAIRDQVWNKIEAPLITLGFHDLKNLRQSMEVLRVVLPWEDPALSPSIRGGAPRIAPNRSRVAVLPLTCIGADPENTYFTDGMTEELIYALSKVQGMHVISQTSVMTYKTRPRTVAQIGRELGVGTVLEGSVRRDAERFRIHVQLVDVATETHLWADRFDRKVEDVFAVQSEIAECVAHTLKLRLIPQQQEPSTCAAPACTAYLKGRHYWNKRSKVGLARALEMFQKAAHLDPTFAPAFAGMSDTYAILADRGYMRAAEAYAKARQAAQKALELNPQLAEAHAALGLVTQYLDRNPAAAERSYQHAILLNPSYASAHQWYSLLLAEMGRTGEALAESQLAVETSPRSPVILASRGDLLRKAGRIEEAEAQYRQALQIDPAFVGIHARLAQLKLTSFKWDEALDEAAQAVERDPKDLKAVAVIASVLAVTGRGADADPWIARLPAGKVPSHAAHLLRLRRRYPELLALPESPDAPPEQIAWVDFQKAVALTCLERFEDAFAALNLAAAKDRRADSKLALWIAGRRAVAHFLAGQPEMAIAHRESVERFVGDSLDRPSIMALIAFAGGGPETGFEQLAKAIDHRCPWLMEVPVEPLLDPFRDRADPRYQAIIRRLGFAV